jgi:hypothetical protein
MQWAAYPSGQETVHITLTRWFESSRHRYNFQRLRRQLMSKVLEEVTAANAAYAGNF